MRVRLPLGALKATLVKPVTRQHGTLESRVRISQVARRQEVNIGAVAQLGERYSENVEVAGSTPAGTTKP